METEPCRAAASVHAAANNFCFLAPESADRSDLPPDVPRTWIMTLSDRALSMRQQLTAIESLGGVETMVCIDGCHDVMVSDPVRLAAILADRCRMATRP